MLEVEIVQGSEFNTILQPIVRSDGSLPVGLLDTDVLTATFWRGADEVSLFSPTVSWFDSTTGKFNYSVASAQTSGLDYAGIYHSQVTSTRGTTPTVIADFLASILPAPGTATQVITPYCTLKDILKYAPWITMVQDDVSDEEGFYSERLEAKEWLDWLIVRSYRGTSAAYFGDPGRPASQWMGGWARRSPMPSQWLINQLSGGRVVPPLTLAAQGSGYTFANVVFSGGGPNATQATAYAIVAGGQVISLFLIDGGHGYSSTPAMAIAGDGTGAAGTCRISANVLMLRPPIVRICALKAASIIGLGQIGRMNNIANFGAMFRDMAAAESQGIVAELDLDGNGLADVVITLASTNTLFT